MTGVVLLVDDVRRFRDGRECVLARTPDEAIAALAVHPVLAELWLDFDLGHYRNGRSRSVLPFVEEIVRAAAAGSPYAIDRIFIHSSNPAGALAIRRALAGVGYAVERHYAPIWRHDL